MSLRLAPVLAVWWSLAACSQSAVILERVAPDGGNASDAGAGRDADVDVEPGSAAAVAASGYSCAVDDAGLWCWGVDDEGDAPLGGPSDGEGPQRAGSAGAYVQLCSAEVHSCGLRKDGEIECWGANEHGQLGLGHVQTQRKPTPLQTGLSFVSVACGGRASCAVADTGSLYCWGDNSEGLAAQDDAYDSPDVLAPKPAALSLAVRQVSVGQGHACAVAISGALYCWGRNTDSQLGLGPSPIQLRVPTPADPEARYHHVAAGQQHTCGIRSDGTLYCWGRELSGRMGQGELQDGKIRAPGQVGNATDYVSVGAHWFHACARHLNGRLECWGRNEEGQLGVGDFEDRNVPTPITSAPFTWTSFSVGRFHTCALNDGQVYCWGMNDTGALGLVDPARQNAPVRVPLEE